MSDLPLDYHRIWLEAERQAVHKATDLLYPFTKEWYRKVDEIKHRIYKDMVTPPENTQRCKCCGN